MALDKPDGTAAPDRVAFFAAADGADILEDTNLADLGALMRGLQVGRVNPEAEAVAASALGSHGVQAHGRRSERPGRRSGAAGRAGDSPTGAPVAGRAELDGLLPRPSTPRRDRST